MVGRKSLAAALLASAIGGGCGTVDNLRQPTVAPTSNPDAPICRVYGGVRGDWAAMSTYPWDKVTCTADYLLVPIMGFDLIFTFVGDTFTLPYTAGTEIWRLVGHPKPRDYSLHHPVVVVPVGHKTPTNVAPVPVGNSPAPTNTERAIPDSETSKFALPPQ